MMNEVGIGGAGFPKPDTPEVAVRQLAETGGVDLSRAVDLGRLKKPAENLHRWMLVVKFAMAEEDVNDLHQTLTDVRRQVENGEMTETEIAENPVNINYDPSAPASIDGPGCAKCGVIWYSPEGAGAGCRVTDAEYEAVHGGG